MMKFDEYDPDALPEISIKTSRSEVSIDKRNKRTTKRYLLPIQRLKEELAYRFVDEFNLLRTPKLLEVGDNYIVIEYLEGQNANIDEAIREIASFHYKSAKDNIPKDAFEITDVSKERLIKIIEGIEDPIRERQLLDDVFCFIDNCYKNSDFQCLVHGDLLVRHSIKHENELFFIDLELMAQANPFYDISLLFLESKDKNGLFNKLLKSYHECIETTFGGNHETSPFSLEESAEYLHSSIFFRVISTLSYYLHHKPQSIEKIFRDLEHVLSLNR